MTETASASRSSDKQDLREENALYPFENVTPEPSESRQKDAFFGTINETGKRLLGGQSRSAYDIEALNLLKDKQFLAWILRDCTTEFQGMPIEDIIPCIDEASVGIIPVEPGMTNTAAVGLPSESKIPGEGFITFDIRFYARKPGIKPGHRKRTRYRGKPSHKTKLKVLEINLIFDIELQNKEKPGYDVVVRGIFYCGRMLSEQMGHSVTGKNYDRLQKVYSIWICMNTPAIRANTISRYSIQHDALYGHFQDIHRYDLMQVILIRLPRETSSRKPKNPPSRLHQLLSSAFSSHTQPEQKLRILQQMGIRVTEELRKEVNSMCNLSEGIYQEGHATGLAEGHATGLAEGHATGLAEGHASGLAEGHATGLAEGLSIGRNQTLSIIEYCTRCPGQKPQDIAQAVGCSIDDAQIVLRFISTFPLA